MATTSTVLPASDRLYALRKRAGLPQTAIAGRVHKTQAWLSGLENHTPTTRSGLLLLAALYTELLGEIVTLDSLIAPAKAPAPGLKKAA